MVATTTIATAKQDFHDYVNKKWLDDPANSIPSEYTTWGGFTILADNGLKNQIKLVKELCEIPKDKLTVDQKKITAIWAACQNRFKMWEDNKGDYKAIEAEFEVLQQHFPTDKLTTDDYLDALSKYMFYCHENGIGSVIDFGVGSDLTCSNNVVLDISCGGFSLPSRDYYFDDMFQDKRELFKQHLFKVAKFVDDNTGGRFQLGSEGDYSDWVNRIWDFETEMAYYSMKPDQAREYDKYFTNTNLTQIKTNINELNALPAKQDNYKDGEKNFKLEGTARDHVETLLEKLYKLYGLRDILEQNYEKNFVNNKVENSPKYKDQITAYDGDAIRRVLAFIVRPDILPKYLAALQYAIIHSNYSFCKQELDLEFFDFYSRKLNGQKEQKDNDKRSMSMVNGFAGELMGKVYVSKYFPDKAKSDIKHMIKEQLDIMKISIERNDWLTLETKRKASEKIDKFNSKIGFPDVWKDFSQFVPIHGDDLYEISKKATKWSLKINFINKINSVKDKHEWHMTPQTVNAYFSPTQNEIVFPAAILQPPFYHLGLETIDFDYEHERNMLMLDNSKTFPLYLALFVQAANLGAIGGVIAHEITHGYDDNGRKFDGDGNLKDWWSKEDADLFEAKTKIMALSVDRYVFIDKERAQEHLRRESCTPEEKRLGGKMYKMNPQLTMGENLADLGGLSLSLQVLQRVLLEKKIDSNSVKHKAIVRVFFKSWANIWKTNIKVDSRINRLATDPHAPSEFRANMVNHIDAFYTAFDVVENDAMYLKRSERVVMW